MKKKKILIVILTTLFLINIFSVVGSKDLTKSWKEVQKIKPHDGQADSLFGAGVYVNENRAIIGAYADDEMGNEAGAAYIYKRDGNTWIEEAKLTAFDANYDDMFGISTCIEGNYAIVGSIADDDKGYDSGSVYIFKYDGDEWCFETKLTASDGSANDWFGGSVAFYGEYLIIGADGDNNQKGSAYIFKRTDSTWMQEAKISPSNLDDFDHFGYKVDISYDYAIISAIGDDDKTYDCGAAYVFKKAGSSWIKEAKLIASDGGYRDVFGMDIALYGDYAIIGAEYDDTSNGVDSGSAYIFKRTDSTWIEEAKIIPSNGVKNDLFGGSVSIYENYAVIGSGWDDTENGENSGSAYIYKRTDSTWSLEKNILASDGEENDHFGSVWINGNYIFIGAAGDEDNGEFSGSVYIFTNEEDNFAPNVPKINGPTKLKINQEGSYKVKSTDPEEDQVYYYIDWGDGNKVEWDGPYDSGLEVIFTHSWEEKGSYQLKVKAKDINGQESDWGYKSLTIPKNRFFTNYLIKFLENHPFIYRLIATIFGP